MRRHRGHNRTNGKETPASRRRSRRCIALLGGTTTLADSLAAAYYLMNPRHLITGTAIGEYERAFAQQIGVRYAHSFCSARVGLYGLLSTLGVGRGDEVIVPVPTHVVVVNAVRYTGARPVYVDCQPETCNIDLEQAERRITPRTKVLILQHTFGIPVDLDAAQALARRCKVEIIEDCVHALGARYGGRPVGSFGRAAFFSTEETKTISSTMGGMVVTDDPDLASRMRMFQERCAWPSAWLTASQVLKFIVYGILTEPHLHRYTRILYEVSGRRQLLPGPTQEEERRGALPAGYEQRLSNAQAALALRQLRRLEGNLAHRRAVANEYCTRLAGIGFRVAQPPAKAEPAFVRYPVWVKDRAAAQRFVARYAVLGVWFNSVLQEAVSAAHFGYETGSCRNAEAAAKHLVNLPTHPRVRAEDIDLIISAMAEADSIGQSQHVDFSSVPKGPELSPIASLPGEDIVRASHNPNLS